ncbi:putative start control protein [Botrytis fragariae]|uniref:Putative start control protein n=1 Tax=Botrytis fragariae TaxID=1964551 RepID=A0A8H6ART8_9HELO|nr:putative start control protein [Botrytis fragariae]KAF5872344.1 putative start control protein [Botrytis fragariae]
METYTLSRLELLFAGQFIDFEQALSEHTSDGGARANFVERCVLGFEKNTDDDDCVKQSTKRMIQEKLPTMSVSRSAVDDARQSSHKRVKMEAQLLNDIDDSQTMKPSENTSHTNKLYVVPDRGSYYWQLAIGGNIIAKRQDDDWVNITSILALYNPIVTAKHFKHMEIDKLKKVVSAYEVINMRSGISGTYMPLENAVLDRIHELGLYDQTKDLLDARGDMRPKLEFNKATFYSEADAEPKSISRKGRNFISIKTSRCFISRNVANNWINGSQVILAAGASSAEYNAIIQRYTKGIGEELKMGTSHLNGWYFPYHKAIKIAKEWNVIDLVGGLLVHDMPFDDEAEVEDISKLLTRSLRNGELRTKSHENKTYLISSCGANIVSKRLNDSWLNATQILALVLNPGHRHGEMRRIHLGEDYEIVMNSRILIGTYIPLSAGIALARRYGVLEKIQCLLEDEQLDDVNDSSDSSPEDDENVEVESEAVVKQNWRSLSLTNSTGTSFQDSLDNVGQMIVISRNTSNGSGRRPRPRLLTDGLASFESFKKCFAVTFSENPTVVGFNGLSSTASARYNVSSNGDNVIDKDRERIIDGVRATPEGTKCVILIRGIDGWTSNVESLREFSKAFENVDIWLVSAVTKGWGHSEAWREESNGVRYNVFPMSALSMSLPSWQVSHFVTVLDKIQHEKKQGRGAHIGWLTRGRAFVL